MNRFSKLFFIVGSIAIFIIAIVVLKKSISDQSSDIKNIVDSERNISFNDVFEEAEEFIMQDESFYQLVGNLIQLEFTTDSLVVIPSSLSKTVYIADFDGNMVQKITKNGRGPGEFEMIGRVSIDNSNNVYVYDPSQKKLIKFNAPDYITYEEYFSPFNLSKFVVVNNIENIVSYSPYNDFLFTQFDLTSDKVTNSYLKGEDSNFKIWLSRIQTGGVVYDRANNELFGIYPENLIIYRFNEKLEETGVFKSTDSDKFKQEFPGNLDPYDYTQRHLDWWNNTSQIGRIFLIRSGVIGVTYYHSTSENPLEKPEFLNIYDLDSNSTIAKDLLIPDGGSVVGFTKDKIWLLYSASIDSAGNEILTKIMTHSFR